MYSEVEKTNNRDYILGDLLLIVHSYYEYTQLSLPSMNFSNQQFALLKANYCNGSGNDLDCFMLYAMFSYVRSSG